MNDFALDTRAAGMNPDGSVRFGAENQMLIKFYKGTKLDAFNSQAAGVPMHKAVDMLEIRQFGEKDSTVREVTESDKMKFANQWARYQQGLEQIQDGTPLDVLFPKNPEIVASLKGVHVHTIQALAAVPDSSNMPFMGDHRKKAKAFLDSLEGGKGYHELEKKLEDSELRNMELEDRIKALEQAVRSKGEDEDEPRRGPGRPRKSENGE